MRKLLLAVIIALSAVAALIIVYFTGLELFAGRFLPNTVIGGEDVSFRNTDEFLKKSRERYPDEFTITEKDGSLILMPLDNVILNHDIEDFVIAESEKHSRWYEAYFNKTEFTPRDDWSVDEAALRGNLNEALKKKEETYKRTAPKDAYFDTETLEIVPEVEGNTLDPDKVMTAVTAALNSLKTDARLKDEYLYPEVYSDDPSLTSIIEEKESYIHKVTIKLDAGAEKKLKADKVASWLIYKDGHFDFDSKKVNKYVKKLAEKYDTAYTERSFTTSKGNVITIGNGPEDNYGGYILNQGETAAALYKALVNRKKEVQCVWDMTGYTIDENGDIGGTYIEISIPDQHMWIYKDHELAIETDVITGLPSDPSRATPTGLFLVMEMRSPYVMHGSYGSQPCTFFIRVTGYGVAIHDANWQSSFGGNAYYSRGSHGCINTPYGKVAELWDLLSGLDNFHVPIIIY